MKTQARQILILLRLIHLRHWTRHPWSSIAFCAVIAVGVAAFFSIRLANRAAITGFTHFDKSLGMRPDAILTAPSGRMTGAALAQAHALIDPVPAVLAPVLETTATEADVNDQGLNTQQFLIVGLDPFAMSNLTYHDPGNTSNKARLTWLRQEPAQATEEEIPAGVVISRQMADKRKLKPGESMEVIIDDHRVRLSVLQVAANEVFQVSQPESILFMDIEALRSILNLPDAIHRIEVFIPPGHFKEDWLSRVCQQLETENTWILDVPESALSGNASMTRAFRLNLSILSSLALIVGMYLIMQGMDAAIVKRRLEMATLVSLGITPRGLKTVWLIESLWFGMLGSGAGLCLGWIGAQWAVKSVASTVNALYLQSASQAAGWDWGDAGLAFGLGCLASLAAGWFPSSETANTRPAETFKQAYRGGFMTSLNRPGLGLLFGLSGWIAASLPPYQDPAGQLPLGGYAAALLWVIGSTLIAPAGLGWIARILRPLAGVSAVWAFCLSQLRHPTGRHYLSVSALTVAVGMAGGMSYMIHSFENTMVAWISKALKADLYIACQGMGSATSQNRLSVETWQSLSQHPGVAKADVGQVFPIQLRGQATYLTGMPVPDPRDWEYAMWIHPPAETATPSTEESLPQAVINESFQTRFQVDPGDHVRIPTPTGRRSVRVVGVFAEYGNERGSIAVDRRLLAAWFKDARAVNIALYLKEGEDPETIRNAMLQTHSGIAIRTQRRLREEILEIFHQTFSVTRVLQWIAIAVALVGLAMAMATSLMERKLELQILRNLGMTRQHMALSTGMESLACAYTGFACGSLLSLCLGWLLVRVINKQAFGWTLVDSVPWTSYSQLLAGITVATLVISIPLGWWVSRLRMHKEE